MHLKQAAETTLWNWTDTVSWTYTVGLHKYYKIEPVLCSRTVLWDWVRCYEIELILCSWTSTEELNPMLWNWTVSMQLNKYCGIESDAMKLNGYYAVEQVPLGWVRYHGILKQKKYFLVETSNMKLNW